jgi:outer membrane protein assembly factor BamA
MDFLPGAWLVRVDGIHASMSMGQPLPGVWLPRQINVEAGFSLATGAFEATYARTFANYKLADVKSIIRVPKGQAPSPEDAAAGTFAPDVDAEAADVRGPAVPEDVVQAEIVREIRVHGNAAVADADVIALAGIAVGQPLGPSAVAEAERRLTQSGRFESVEVRKRYRSLTDETDVAIVLLVHEKPGVTSSAAGMIRRGGTFGRVGQRLMFLPILSYADGYGFSYGARLSTRDLLGGGEHLSFPLTWGATRRAAVEAERSFKTGPLTRVASSVGISQRENPRFRLDDRRVELKGRAERQFARLVRTGLEASRSTVDFGGIDDRLWTLGADVALDTRGSPTFPRNAILLGAGWSGLHIRSRDQRIDRYTTDARGYLGIVGQAVAAGRIRYTAASSALPDYERLLLGGASTLRGFRAGTFDGDRTLVTSLEVRLPISSVLSSARLGVLGFVDAAKAWDAGARAAHADWNQGVGGGVFLIAPLITLNLDLAHGLRNGDTRLHLSAGFGF